MSFDKCIYPYNQLIFRTFSSSQKVPLCILPLTSLLSLTVIRFFIVRIPNSWRVKTEKSVAVFAEISRKLRTRTFQNWSQLFRELPFASGCSENSQGAIMCLWPGCCGTAWEDQKEFLLVCRVN